MKLRTLVAGHQPAGMKDIKDHNSSNHHRPVKGNKIPLRGNQIPTPALRQLDGPVDAPHIDTHDGEDHRAEQRHNRPSHGLQETAAETAPDKVRGEDDEDGDGGHLEDDARDHDVGARRGVAVGIVGRGAGHSAADGLHDERDDVAGDEDIEVETWADDGGVAAQQGDEAAKEDVDACCEEGGCCPSSVCEVYSSGTLGIYSPMIKVDICIKKAVML